MVNRNSLPTDTRWGRCATFSFDPARACPNHASVRLVGPGFAIDFCSDCAEDVERKRLCPGAQREVTL